MYRSIRGKVMRFVATLTLVLAPGAVVPALAGDWPMFRHDAGRGAATEENLAEELHLQWVRRLPSLEPGWPGQEKLQFDAHYEPVVLGQTMFVGSSRTDSLTAYDTRTGQRRWVFHADGPVRLAPAAHRDRVYFTSDDGYLYCVAAADGRLVWKFRGGPSDRKILGNGRLISTWPARGGPVIADDTVYFAASIWPFMGIFIHALDAQTGDVAWTNDGDGSMYILQPHNAYSFAGVAPQGPLVVSGDRLLVPGGRSVPAVYDRHTGKFLYYHLAANGKRGGGAAVSATEDVFINGGAVFELASGDALGALNGLFAFDQDRFYTAADGHYRVFPRGEIREVEEIDRRGKKQQVRRFVLDKPLFAAEAPTGTDMIHVGSRLYAGHDDTILAIDIDQAKSSADTANPSVIGWQTSVDGAIARLLAADGRLFAVTEEGSIYCFGSEKTSPAAHDRQVAAYSTEGQSHLTSDDILKLSGAGEGYCICWGVGDGTLIGRLIEDTDLHVIGIDPDPVRASTVRRQLIDADLYGDRASIHVGTPDSIELPAYLASLMVIDDSAAAQVECNPQTLSQLFQVLRPYGGALCVWSPRAEAAQLKDAINVADLAGARIAQHGSMTCLRREGALPGSANWTHEHADAANTRMSRDSLVKAPLGILWFGGPTNEQILPRHGHGPQPQVVDGRAVVEGADMLRAIDIYTGRLLWERSLPGIGALFDDTSHHPGANGTGGNYVSLPDGIYAIYDRVCLRLDPATGETMSEFALPFSSAGDSYARWRYVNVVGDYLIAGSDLADDEAERDRRTRYDASISSKRLSVLDRHTGRLLWTTKATYGFRHNTVCAGGRRLYCVDLYSAADEQRYKRRGEEPPSDSRLAAYDLGSGQLVWDTHDEVFGTWLSYAERHDILIETGRPGRDVLKDEAHQMRAFAAADGTVLWEEDHHGPTLVHGDRLMISSRQACDLRTGELIERDDPVTGQSVTWRWDRNYGCNAPQGSEHLLVFRSGAAGYYDLAGDGGTGNFGGFRSSCTNNLIVAGGVLTAPDYTRTCVCGYQNQTSVGLVHMPEAEMWTQFEWQASEHHAVRHIGINLGAPGHRRAANGRLWWNEFEGVEVEADDPGYYNGHSGKITGQGPPWVAASGCRGIRRLTLDTNSHEPAGYIVRLHFCDVDNDQPGARVFDVSLNGEPALSNLDIVRESGGRHRAIVKQLSARTDSKGRLEITFEGTASEDPRADKVPVLNGLEVVRQD